MFFLNVLAENSNNTDNNQTVTPSPQNNEVIQLNYEDLISKARIEERNKAEVKINNLKKEKEILTNKNNELLIQVAEAEEKLKATTNGEDTKLIEELKAELSKAQEEIKSMNENSVDVEELRNKIEEELKNKYEIKFYKEQQILTHKDCIISELVTGETKEEIDNSIELSKKRFEEMRTQILGTVQRTVPPINPNTSSFQSNNINMQDLANLDPRSSEYKELRAKLGLK